MYKENEKSTIFFLLDSFKKRYRLLDYVYIIMIKAILVFNNSAKPRLIKFFEHYPEEVQQQIVRETYQLVSKRDENVCNFLEGGSLIGGTDYRLIYRHYATLYFIFCVDSSESELGILDLIQVFVETLDKCFEVNFLRLNFTKRFKRNSFRDFRMFANLI